MPRVARRWTLGIGFALTIGAGCGGQAGSPSGSGSTGDDGSTGSSGGASSGGGSSGGSGSASGASGGGSSSSGGGSSGAASSSGSGGSTSSSGSASGGQDGGGPKTYPPLQFSAIGQATLVSSQFYFTEGPVWDPSKGVLYFTDINAHQGGTTGGAIYRLTPPSTIDVLLQPDGNADGLGLDPQGNVIAAGFVRRSIWRLSSTTMQTLSPCSSPTTATCYSGQEVNTPDDITSRSDGVLYFTDPTFGSGSQGFPTLTLALSTQGVYRLTKDGTLHIEDMSTSGPNGVNLSPDEKTLYVAYTLGNSVSKFSVASDGSLSNKQTFATGTNLADSMCVDAGGNVYVGTSGGLEVFSPAGGQPLGTISAGGQIVTNCAFGGTDQKTLYITSRAQATLLGTPVANDSSLYRVDNMPVPGIPGQN